MTAVIDETRVLRETGPALLYPPTAAFDLTKRYRYELTRTWSNAPPWVFAMLNPSKANAHIDDPTIRRCCGFAQAGEAGGIVAVNLHGWRATDPLDLALADDPVGDQNEAFILAACTVPGRTVVAAWGAHPAAARRGAVVTTMLTVAAGVRLHCLGTTRDGHPRHPLYVPASTRLEPWPA